VKKEYLTEVETELGEMGIGFENPPPTPASRGQIQRSACFSINGTANLDETESFKKGYFEIQDWASQQTVKFIPFEKNQFWWDACAASGGKSLMMLQEEPSLKIFATDIRETVLKNLSERFRKSNIKNFIAEKEDLTSLPTNFVLPFSGSPDGIIADVPCSGSGTWARTPEWVSRFHEEEIVKFQDLQRKIIINLTKFLSVEKPLIYITCSVFKAENEDNTRYFETNLPLKLMESAYIEGSTLGADTMFAAKFIRI
jgi:16S rRNA (cytosine967-C5)-methyltransferase